MNCDIFSRLFLQGNKLNAFWIVFKVIQSHSLWQGTKELVCGRLPCWAQNKGGMETGHSGFSQDQSGWRWPGGLTATRVFLRKTFQKGWRKKTPSPSVKSYLRPALFSVPRKGQGRKFYICHEISPREAATMARGCHLGVWEPPAGAKEQQECRCRCQPSAPKARKEQVRCMGSR